MYLTEWTSCQKLICRREKVGVGMIVCTINGFFFFFKFVFKKFHLKDVDCLISWCIYIIVIMMAFFPLQFSCAFFFSSSDSSFRYNSGHIFPPCNASGLFVTHRSPSSFHNLPYRVVVCLEVFAWHLSVVKNFWWPNVWFCFFPTSFHAKLFW